jgi:hypothetical protein
MKAGPRTAACSKSDARNRLAHAVAYHETASLVVDDESINGLPSVAASLAVLAGIAASDAVCCNALGRRPRGQDHAEALRLLATIPHTGAAMAKLLAKLLASKDSAHHGTAFISMPDTTRLLRSAAQLIDHARNALDT